MKCFITVTCLSIVACGTGGSQKATGFYCTTLSRPLSSEGATVCSRTVQGCEQSRVHYSQFQSTACTHRPTSVCFTLNYAGRMGSLDYCFDSFDKCRFERDKAARREDFKYSQFSECRELRSSLAPGSRTVAR